MNKKKFWKVVLTIVIYTIVFVIGVFIGIYLAKTISS